MRKITKRIISFAMATTMIIGSVPYNNPMAVDTVVQAATDMTAYKDDYVVDLNIIKSSELLNALNQIIPQNGEKLTFGMLKSYTGKIDLTAYPNINDVTGLGYAINASSIDMSTLTKVNTIYESEFRQCKFTEFVLPPNLVYIQSKAFLGCSNLQTINLPSTLKQIGGQAFESCSSLDGIALPAGLEKLGDESFANCKSLTEIAIPDNINAALEGSSDKEILTGVGASVFNGCTSLQSIKFGAAMTIIPAGFLQNTQSLLSVEIPASITDIRSSAFSGSGIRAIDLSKNNKIKVINTTTFSGCHNLKKVVLPDSIEKIESNAFNSCSSLLDTEFLNGLNNLVEIGSYAFAHSGFTSVHIPGNVKNIGLYAFSGCDDMVNLVIEDFTYTPTQKVTKEIGNYAFYQCIKLRNVTLPDKHEDNDNVELTIGNYAFYQCMRLASVNFPLSLTQIGEYAFAEASRSVTDWEDDTDEFPGIHTGETGYVKISDIKDSPSSTREQYVICTDDNEYPEYLVPQAVYIDPNRIYDKSLYNQYRNDPTKFKENYKDNAELVEMYSDITGEEMLVYYESQKIRYIDSSTIYSQYTLASKEDKDYETKVKYYVSDYYMHDTRQNGDVEFNVYNDSEIVDTVYIDPSRLKKSIVHPNGGSGKSVEKYVRLYSEDKENPAQKVYLFEDLIYDEPINNKMKAYIVSGTTKIHTQCITGLTELDLSKNIGLEIGKGAFSNNKNLKKVTLPEDMTMISDGIFSGCYVNILRGIGGKGISDDQLADEDWYSGLESVIMSDKVTHIGSGSFEECRNLKLDEKLGLPDELIHIGEAAYRNCESIGDVVMPSLVEYIGDGAFYGCSRIVADAMCENIGLTSLDVTGASSLQYIGTNAFGRTAIKLFDMSTNASVSEIYAGTFSECQFLERISLSPSVIHVGNNAMNLCYRLETLFVSDTCLLDAAMCEGTKMSKTLPGSLPHYNVMKPDGTYDPYFHTRKFVLSLNIQNPKLSVIENGKVVLPLTTVDPKGSSYYKLIKIGENSNYTFDPELKELFVDNSNKYVSPEVDFEYTKIIGTNKYIDKTKSLPACAIWVNGLSEVTGLNLMIEEELHFTINKSHNSVIIATPTAQYALDVTKNPCKDIVYEDRVYVDYSGSKVINPTFVPLYPSSDVSDKVVWNIESGEELINLVPSKDGRTAEVVSAKSGYGTASIKVTAGEVSKIIYINVATPASKITLTKTNIEMSIGATSEIGATISYSSANQANSVLYGDNVKYTSSDETIVKIEHFVDEKGTNCARVVAVGYGRAVITATSMAKESVKAQCNVYVVASDVGMTVTDSNGNEINNNHRIVYKNGESATYSYLIDSELELSSLSCVADDPDLVQFSYDAKKKTFTLKAKKHGSSKVVVYPSAASPDESGIVLYVTSNADVKEIILSKMDVSVYQTVNVFVEMQNVLGDVSNIASEEGFASVTDNRIEFTSSNESIATVDAYGNVTALKYTSQSSIVTITCTAYSGERAVATKNTYVYIQAENSENPTKPGGSTGEPVIPSNVTCVSEKPGTLLINATDPGNGQQFRVYIDGIWYMTASSLPIEVTGLEPGVYQVYITGYLNGKESGINDFFDGVRVEKEVVTEEPTVPETTTEKATEKVTEKPTQKPTQKPTEPVTTQKTTTNQPQTTKQPTTTKQPVTVKPTTKAPTVTPQPQVTTTANVTVPKAKIKSVKRDKKNKQAKVTLKKTKGAQGYEIAYSTSKKFKKKDTKTVTVKSLNKTVKKLKANKKYYFRARAYVLVNGKKKYGKWSAVKTVKVKK